MPFRSSSVSIMLSSCSLHAPFDEMMTSICSESRVFECSGYNCDPFGGLPAILVELVHTWLGAIVRFPVVGYSRRIEVNRNGANSQRARITPFEAAFDFEFATIRNTDEMKPGSSTSNDVH